MYVYYYYKSVRQQPKDLILSVLLHQQLVRSIMRLQLDFMVISYIAIAFIWKYSFAF
jgi:hypothetical protein